MLYLWSTTCICGVNMTNSCMISGFCCEVDENFFFTFTSQTRQFCVMFRKIFFCTLLALIHFFLIFFVKLMALEITLCWSICVLIHPCEVHKSWVPGYVGDWTLYGGVQYFQHNYCTSLASSHLSGALNLEMASRVLDSLWTQVSTITTVLFTFLCRFLSIH